MVKVSNGEDWPLPRVISPGDGKFSWKLLCLKLANSDAVRAVKQLYPDNQTS